jgi:hypothetical protein
MPEVSTPVAIGAATPVSEAPPLDPACCKTQPASASTSFQESLADLLRRHNVNDYAASVKVYAVK